MEYFLNFSCQKLKKSQNKFSITKIQIQKMKRKNTVNGISIKKLIKILIRVKSIFTAFFVF